MKKWRNESTSDPVSVVERTRRALSELRLSKWSSACPVVTVTQAETQAVQADVRRCESRRLSELDGLHVVWKDNIDQINEVTRCGSRLRNPSALSTCNALCVDRLEGAGMVSIARTGMSEFAFSGLGLNPHFGTPSSALSYKTPLLPGGSSSGAAVVVAKGLADLGVGTDTSGSIRIPAALNGIFGFRPSSLRYDRSGVHELSKTLDTVGTLSRSFDVLRFADKSLSGMSVSSVHNHKFEIFDLSESLDSMWSDEVARSYDKALQSASAAGWSVTKKRLDSISDLRVLLETEGQLVAIEARRKYADILSSEDANLIDPMIRERLSKAPILTDSAYARYLKTRTRMVADARSEIGNKLIAFPTVPSLRHELATYENDQSAALQLNAKLLANTMLTSLLDCPGVAVPLNNESGRVSGSILISAASNNDGNLLTQTSQFLLDINNTTYSKIGE